MPTPRLKAGFLIIESGAGMETKASSLKGAFTFGRTVTINDIPAVDLVVQGAVAVDKTGRRVGKGGGYGDREVAALKKYNKMPTAPIAVTVHDIQVVEKLPQNAWDFTVDIIVTPTQIINTTKRKAISKYMSSILRHHPPDTMSDNGFIPLKELFVLIQEKYSIDKEFITSIAEKDSKGRFQIKGEKIRALYGHSCPVTIELPPADSAVLYHGTTAKAAEKIRSQGLIPKKRQKVHLSPTPDVAVEVGKRKCKNPVVLKIDAEKALKEGVIIEKASDSVYVADFIPPQYIS
jgi:putative RNA 2'-phosphotransferase